MTRRLLALLGSSLVQAAVYVVLLVVCIYYVYSSIHGFRRSVGEMAVRPTQLNILEILDTKKLVMAQQGVDFFLNTGDYVAVVPYTVKAGFNLGKYVTSTMTREGDSVVIRLPKPEILSVTHIDDAKETVIADGNPDPDFVRGMRIFGERYAESVARKRNLLLAANKRAEMVLPEIARALGIREKVQVQTSPPDELAERHIETDFLPIALNVPESFPFEVRSAKRGETLGPWSFTAAGTLQTCFSVYPVELEHNVEYKPYMARLFDVMRPNKVFGLWKEYSNGGLDYVYVSGDRLFLISMETSSKLDAYKHLPDFMSFLYGLDENARITVSTRANLAGHTCEDFEGMSVRDKKFYFRILDMWSLDMLGELDTISVVTDRAGLTAALRNEGAWQEKIDAAKNRAEINDAKLIGILYDPGSLLYRECFLFFKSDGCVFYAPETTFLSQILIALQYADFFDRAKANVKSGTFYLGGKGIASPLVNQALVRSYKMGIISLYNPGQG